MAPIFSSSSQEKTQMSMISHQKKHVAVLPFPFTSHPAALAKMVLRLAAAAPSVHFSFLNVPNSNTLIFPSTSKNHLPTNFKIFDIAAPSDPNYETGAESYFNSAPTSYESVMEAAVAEIGVPVSCILADVMTACACDLSWKMCVKWIAVWVAAPYSLLNGVQARAIVDYVRLRGGFDAISHEIMKKKIDFIPGLSMFKVEDLSDLILREGKGNMPAMKRILALESKLPNAAAVVLNCFEDETLAETVAALRSKLQTLVLHIGCPDISFTMLSGDRSENSDPSGCLSWLDQQSPKSVVYVCFGTTSLLSTEEISAIAEALEERKAPYLWSLKDRTDHLPAGFIERTSSYGKLVPWAPQTLVLCHPSIGAHLMHAGFNSMVESIFAEVPMICRPLWAENPMNAQMVENVWRIGVRVDERVITKSGLLKCLEMVLGRDGEQGRMMRERIGSLKEVMVKAGTPNGSATKCFKSLMLKVM